MDKIIAALETALAAAHRGELACIQISFKTARNQTYISLGMGDPVVLWGLAARMLETCKRQALGQSTTEVTALDPHAN